MSQITDQQTAEGHFRHYAVMKVCKMWQKIKETLNTVFIRELN